jgi:hypothetical protein
LAVADLDQSATKQGLQAQGSRGFAGAGTKDPDTKDDMNWVFIDCL